MAAKRCILASVTFLEPDAGGRLRPPVDSPSYRPHLVLQDGASAGPSGSGQTASEAYLGVAFSGSGKLLAPGAVHEVVLQLLYPGVDYSGLVSGSHFTIREGPHTVGHGRVIDGAETR